MPELTLKIGDHEITQEFKFKLDYGGLIPEMRKLFEEMLPASTSLTTVEEEPRVTIDHLLEELKISKVTFYRLRKKYDIPCEYAGRRILFKLSEVRKALQAPVYLRRN